MSILGHLEPNNVFRFFEEMCGIPHGSGNTEGMTAYLMKFAADRGLEHRRDEIGNVVIRKPATSGYEEVPGIIIQGHMDMVAVKTPDCPKDLKTDGLDLAVDGDFVYAINTSLGGDDGVAVAYGLAILDAEDIPHPEVELIITVDEETGLFGAKAIDVSDIKGRRFLNIDSEDEGFFLISCAGGIRIKGELPVDMASVSGQKVTVAVKGLQGGHSGGDIHFERGNALYLLARILNHASKSVKFNLASYNGGTVENAIPREATAEVVFADSTEVSKFVEIMKACEKDLQAEYIVRDAGLFVEVAEGTEDAFAVYTDDTTAKLLHMLVAAPVGVQAMSQDVKGLVETSLNLGVAESTDTSFTVQYSVRSSVESIKYALVEKMEVIFGLVGAKLTTSGEYPGWAYRPDSPLRDKMIRVYEEMFGEKPGILAIHAGLECGLFLGKQPDFDCVSFGPSIQSIHTTEEKLSVSSVQRMWKFLLAILADKA